MGSSPLPAHFPSRIMHRGFLPLFYAMCLCPKLTAANWDLNEQQQALDLKISNHEGIGEFMSLRSMTILETSERSLHIVTAETRNVNATLLGKSAKNDGLEQVGYGRKWEGFKTKVNVVKLKLH